MGPIRITGKLEVHPKGKGLVLIHPTKLSNCLQRLNGQLVMGSKDKREYNARKMEKLSLSIIPSQLFIYLFVILVCSRGRLEQCETWLMAILENQNLTQGQSEPDITRVESTQASTGTVAIFKKNHSHSWTDKLISKLCKEDVDFKTTGHFPNTYRLLISPLLYISHNFYFSSTCFHLTGPSWNISKCRVDRISTAISALFNMLECLNY